MNDDERDVIDFCAEELHKITNFEEVMALHWVAFADGEGDHYCLDCCEEEVDKINKESVSKGEEPEAFVDGGWGGIEEDGCTFCYNCEVRLDASLTQYAVESEVDHFLHCDLINQEELSNGQLIELYDIFYYGSEWSFDEECEKDILKLACIVLSILGKAMGVESRSELLDL